MKFVLLVKSSLLFNTFYYLYCLCTNSLQLNDLKTKKLCTRNFQGLLFMLNRSFVCYCINCMKVVLNPEAWKSSKKTL